jgi:hypothetical protein
MKFNIVTGLLFITQLATAQYDLSDVKEDSTKKESNVSWYDIRERTYVGGDFSLRFGTQTYVYLAPMCGYDLIPDYGLSAGLSTMYQLYRIKYTNGAVVSDHAFGGGIFVRYRPFPFLLAQAEFNIYNVKDYSSIPSDRINIPACLVGAGYAGAMGDKSYYNIMLMYDLIHNPNMPLPPIFSSYPIYLKYGFVFYLG